MDGRPSVFLAYSTEARDIASMFKLAAHHRLDIRSWEETGTIGRSVLENIEKSIDGSDFAIVLLTPDDRLESRGDAYMAPRDNLLFELGFARGILGGDRVFVLTESNEAVKLPGDLDGVVHALYSPPASATPHGDEWKSEMANAFALVMGGIEKAGPRRRAAAPTVEASLDTGLASQIIVAAQAGLLPRLVSANLGEIAVHPIHGAGRIVGYDPPTAENQLIRVQFSAGSAIVWKSELFTVLRTET
ncbi:nucleotide-binding protein [Actinotalea sp. M2MS4P-6]|uniref:nucleotide-binding protein n=1 Tax=Actinotalea sp. M2MS4P-6 TaxID=2983762 RepID=UPI0021E38F02|nr:nucleotide-binding protein [Actinotalea sp. M2MS4P-6]MCV2393682.1 nucleotide-binding protein [Actinotalea sp. M2MS4P-6]